MLGVLEPRARVIAVIGSILIIVNLSDPRLLAAVALFWGFMAVTSGRSWFEPAKRGLVGLPVVLVLVVVHMLTAPGAPGASDLVVTLLGDRASFSVSHEGIVRGGIFLLRFTGAFLAVTSLAAVTPSNHLFNALSRLGVPSIFIVTAQFALRYLAVLQQEGRRMSIARQSRGQVRASSFWAPGAAGSIGQLIGALFTRSAYRAERVYAGMLSRGYDGFIRLSDESSLSWSDYAAAGVVLSIHTGLLIIELVGL